MGEPRARSPSEVERASTQDAVDALGAYRAEVRRRLNAGEVLSALDLLHPRGGGGEAPEAEPADVLGALARPPGVDQDPGCRQLAVRAALELGRHDEAERLLGALEREARPDDEETHALRGRLEKDAASVALAAGDAAGARAALARAAATYQRVFARAPAAWWSGVNAATLTLSAGRREDARRLAERVLGELPSAPAAGDPWAEATRGEALLVLGRLDEALAAYGRARPRFEGRWRDLTSTRRNARLALGEDAAAWARLDRVLAPPTIAVVVGGSVAPAREAAVAASLTAWIGEHGVRIGYAGLSGGAEVLFHEALESSGGEPHPILPCAQAQVLADLESGEGGRWAARARALLTRHHEHVRESARHRAGREGVELEFRLACVEGAARLHARRLEASVVRLAVGEGGGAPADVAVGAGPGPAADGARIGHLLFADASGFSRLDEAQVRAFVPAVLGPVAETLSRAGLEPLVRETWGDGIFLAFAEARAAARAALRLRDLARLRPWTAAGLPASLGLRIGVHSGPIWFAADPVSGRRRAFGTHVSHAARIEPVAGLDEVFASEAFASLCAVEGADDVACAYLGPWRWAKGYGVLPTYRLEWAPGHPRPQVPR